MPPNFLVPDLARIPQELRELPRWVTWRAEGAPGEKPRKVPYRADLPNVRASATDMDTWASFTQAEAAYLDGDRAGVGFVLAGDGLAGIDIDHCADAATGEVHPAALRLLEGLGAAYIEFSPSGTGLRAFGYAEGLQKGTKGLLDGLEVELYSTGRYLTLTGHALKAEPLRPLQGFAELAQRIDATRRVNSATGEATQAPVEERHADCVRRILSGDAGLHDALRGLASSLVATGMRPGAVVNHLRGLMDSGTAPRDERWMARRTEIHGLVESAARKFTPAELVGVSALLERMKAGAACASEGLPTPKRYRFMSAHEVATLPPPLWRIKGVIPQTGTGAMFGPPGCGKSFLQLDMAAAIAEGREWFGRRVSAAPVVYLALEGAAGFAMRCRAWEQAKGRPMPQALHIVTEPFNFDRPQDCADLLAAVLSELPPDRPAPVIIFDTLARAAAGLDENSAQDMGRLVAAADAIARATGGFALLVHHTGKDEARGMRGSTTLHGAMDIELRLWRDQRGDRNERHWKVEKSKDGRDDLEGAFTLKVVDLGTDDDGDPITSCVVEPVNAADAMQQKKRLTPAQRSALDSLAQAARERGELDSEGRFTGVHVEAWRETFYSTSTADTQEAKKKAFQRTRDALRNAELVTVQDDFYVPTDPDMYIVIAHALCSRDTGTERDITRTCPTAKGCLTGTGRDTPL